MKLTNKAGEELHELDLGIVNVNESKEYEYFLVNDSVADLIQIQVTVNHPEVEVVKSPVKLGPNEKGEVIIRWSPTLEIKQGLKTSLGLAATELYSA